MAINRYRLNTKVTVAAGTAATPVPGSPGTGGPDGFGNAATAAGQAGGLWPTTWLAGMELLLDPAGGLYTAIGAGNLTQITTADDVGHSGLSN